MNETLGRAVTTCSLLLLSAFWVNLAQGQATTTTTTTTTRVMTSAEAARSAAQHRHQLALAARQSVIDGEKLLSIYNYDGAADRFQYALDALAPGGEAPDLYNRAESDLALAKEGQAHQLATQSKFAQAASRVEEAIALQPNDPRYQHDLDDLKDQQTVYEEQVRNPEGTVGNPAVTSDFKDKVAAVQKLLFQGDAYFRTGQYERAENTFSKVLILDPYNKAARDAMAHMERYRIRAADLRREEYRDEAMLKVNQEWAEAISPDVVVPPNTQTAAVEPSNRAAITSKLQSIIIDKINFDKLDVASVVQFLSAKSKDLDPQHVGINFVLSLNQQAPPASASGAAPGAAPAAGTGAPAAGAPDATAPPPPGPIHRLVTIQLENVPLSDVLGYIIQQTNLQYSVDDYAVYLRPSIDEGQVLTVRTYLSPPNFFTSSGGLRVSAATSPDQPLTVEDVRSDVTQELKNRGIHFPPGATAVFLPGSSKLVVRNTPEQLDLIANLIEQESKPVPQVQIEAKIAEFTDTALKSLTFNYISGFHGALTGGGGAPGVVPGGGFVTTTGLRDANYAGNSVPSSQGGAATGGLTADSIDTLISNNTSSTIATNVFPLTQQTVVPNRPNQLTVGGIIDGIGFAAVVQAINNLAGVDLISAPTVTTQNNLKANIDIVQEFPYPTSFEKPKLSNTLTEYTSGRFAPIRIFGADILDVGGIDFPLTLAVPPTPREFVTQDVGVSLEVKPTTYPDERIDLDITKASVTDFDGFIDYGVPITTKLAAETDPVVLTAGTINQPVFSTRSMVTRLQILDGQTAVLGGLLREDTQEINDKVPVLGDLPLVGRLFQSKISQRVKRNLLIFITARLIKSNGEPLYLKTYEAEPADVEEALPEPATMGPGVSLPPLSPEEPNS